ncbi:MAG: diphthine--ammonia ligase [Candidatus Methanoplasma sp.]|jgi:ABC transporter with metal-binding/Fe-S-binding domain ATP-binding protein|nr:diphthine--ammonia ligase [Candidatus Methanoplasma sp.]
MRLAALYSGGKDSTLALYLAQQMGHEIPYLVGIMPKDNESWIFHIPNMGIVSLMADSVGIELVTAETSGSEEDDMRSLKEALSPLDIDGVVTGAVWSDYQWDRMNAVCGDMGLKVLAPLWRKDQDTVLYELLASGIRAVIVGCYAEGLDESWLGREIDENAAEELRTLRERYGISVIGEGGEYESMTLDSPMHSKPLSIIEYEKEWKKGSGTLFVKKAELTERLNGRCARSL